MNSPNGEPINKPHTEEGPKQTYSKQISNKAGEWAKREQGKLIL